MSKEIQKHIQHNISFINDLEGNTLRATASNDIHGASPACVIRKNKSLGYVLTVWHPGPSLREKEYEPGILKTTLDQHIAIIRNYSVNYRTVIKKGKRPFSRIKGEIDEMRSLSHSQDAAYLRAVIQITKGFSALRYFETEIFETDVTGRQWGLVEVNVKGSRFHVYGVKVEEKQYLFIDSCDLMDTEMFSDYCWSINIGLSLINGNLWQNEQYIFSYQTTIMDIPLSWSYSTLRKHLPSIYSMVTTIPSSWIRSHDQELKQAYEGKTFSASWEVISNICTWVHQKDAHRAVALLIAEAKCSSLLMMPAGFALALEGLATIFEQWFPHKTAPITEKKKFCILREDIKEILKKWENDPEVNLSILSTKIDQLNSPTNRERLKIPFRLLGIPLTPADEMALDYRNAILHGNVILSPTNKKKFEMDEFELAMRLMTLANAIIFKWAGYKGWIINHVKTQENITLKRIEEPYYRNLGTEEGVDPVVLQIARS